jgi:hypothetical protein
MPRSVDLPAAQGHDRQGLQLHHHSHRKQISHPVVQESGVSRSEQAHQCVFHFICECIDAGKISVDFISTSEQLADILTKPLGRTRFLELCAKIGMVITKNNI